MPLSRTSDLQQAPDKTSPLAGITPCMGLDAATVLMWLDAIDAITSWLVAHVGDTALSHGFCVLVLGYSLLNRERPSR